MFSVIQKVFVTVNAVKVQNFNFILKNYYKVAVIGAAGGIGQPLSMLLKINPDITDLCLYDIAPVTKGVAADVSHINSPAHVSAYVGPKELSQAILYADLVIVPAGVPRKPDMTRDDLFKTNASVVVDITKMVAKYSPCAVMAIITNPVNSTVPIANEVHKKLGTYDPRKVIGVTTLDVVRASAFVGEKLGVDPRKVDVPVIGGHSGITIVPLLSQSCPPISLDTPELDKLTKRIQEAGTEVVKAKAGGGSATLSMAIAAARIAGAIIGGFNGESPIEAAYVENRLTPAKYFATRCCFGRNGVEACYHYGNLTPYEQELYDKMLPDLIKNIKVGEEFVAKNVHC